MRWRVYPRDLIAFVLGALAVLGFAPFDMALVPVASLAGLFYLWNETQTAKAAFRIGWAYGLGLMGFGVFWLHVSIDQFGSVGFGLAVFITLVFVLIVALYFGLAGWLMARLGTLASVAGLLLAAPALWVSVEWLRGWVLSGFPWLAMGYSQIDMPLAGYAPLLGVYGVSWMSALSAVLLMLVVRRGRVAWVSGLVIVTIWLAGAGLRQIDWTYPVGEPLKASLIQGNIPQHRKWERDQLVPTLTLYLTLTRDHWDSDIIIWPETALAAFLDQVDEDFVQPLEQAARDTNTLMMVGVPVYEPETDDYYNAMLALSDARDLYFKRHLVPFGEFLPLRFLLEPLHEYIAVPMADFSRGKPTKPLLRLGPWQVGVSICYEDAFGNEVVQAMPEAHFLVNASNDAWFGQSLAPHQHLQIARMRALETGRYLLRSTNTGVSAVIGAKGEVLGASPLMEQDVLTVPIEPRGGKTPFALWGNRLMIALLLTMLAVWVVILRRRMRGEREFS